MSERTVEERLRNLQTHMKVMENSMAEIMMRLNHQGTAHPMGQPPFQQPGVPTFPHTFHQNMGMSAQHPHGFTDNMFSSTSYHDEDGNDIDLTADRMELHDKMSTCLTNFPPYVVRNHIGPKTIEKLNAVMEKFTEVIAVHREEMSNDTDGSDSNKC